ncbi:MAG: hypothetical protein QOG79_4400 [Mycobacterium sp.]|jgi:hypothetical protein|nr:hypothetical protein [Mycobacterium sp.]MDT5301158.1 hypothetical protein [Mycobacterium sp.]
MRIQIGTLIVTGDPRIQHQPLMTDRLYDIDQDRARQQPPKRHRHPILTHPHIRSLRINPHSVFTGG